MYNLLKIAQTEDKNAIHYCDYHLLSLAIAVVTVTFVLIVFTLFCYAVLWFIHDKMENSGKFKDYVIESELDRRKSPAGIMGRWWRDTCFMLQFTCCGLTEIANLRGVDLPFYRNSSLYICYTMFYTSFSVLCLLNNLRGATLQTSDLNIMCAQLFYLRMFGGRGVYD